MTLAVREHCSGCAACQNACAHRAISMVHDDEGFAYPRIDTDLCVSCGACRRMCPSLHQNDLRLPLRVFAVRAVDGLVRSKSSSGGVFSLLAKHIISNGGVVFGVVWDHAEKRATLTKAVTELELERFCGSKYVQADVGVAYKEVVAELRQGRLVLFSGTPCQVAALQAIARDSAERLVCVDLICHAVPSPLAWKEYAAEREHQADSPIVFATLRSKKESWKHFGAQLEFASSARYFANLDRDPYLRGFLSELYNRPSCYDCRQRELRSGSDITLGDYWGIEVPHPDVDDGKGVSAVLINTAKGAELFDSIRGACVVRESRFEDVCRRNMAIYASPRMHRNRAEFFKRINAGASFSDTVSRLLRPSTVVRLKMFVKRMIGR